MNKEFEKNNEFEKKLEKITKIDNGWINKTIYGTAYYYTFRKDTHCISVCFHREGGKSYVIDNPTGDTIYVGFTEEEALKKVEEIANKPRAKTANGNDDFEVGEKVWFYNDEKELFTGIVSFKGFDDFGHSKITKYEVGSLFNETTNTRDFRTYMVTEGNLYESKQDLQEDLEPVEDKNPIDEQKVLKTLKNIISRETESIDIVYKDCSKKKIQFRDGIMLSNEEYDLIKKWTKQN